MGVTENQFVAELVANILDVEISCFRADLGIESDVQQDISQLFTDILLVISHQGIAKFVSFFYRIGTKAFICLLAVPRTFDPQFVKYVQEASEGFHLFLSGM